MATDKTFSVAGVSTLNGDCKIRFANDVMRVKNLSKSGHEDIRLVEMPEAVLKTEAARFLLSLPEFADAVAQEAIAEYLHKHDKAPRVEVKKAVKKAVTTKKTPQVPALKGMTPLGIKSAEDAPF